MIYLFVILLLLFLSFHYDINGNTKGRAQWYLAVLVIFISIAGMRWRVGSDTTEYIDQFYYDTPVLSDITSDFFTLGSKPLWLLLNSTVLSLGGRFYIVQFIQAAFVNILIFRYIKKHSTYIFICALLYFVWMYFMYNTEEMKASMSVAVCLFANDYLLEKKYYKGLFLIVIGCLFHFSTVLLLITPLLLSLRLNKLGVLILFISFFAGIVIHNLFGDYLELLAFDDEISRKADRWAEGMETKSRNINYYIVHAIPFIIYSLLLLRHFKLKYPNDRLLKLEPFLLLGVITYLLYINVHFFFRFSHFYAVYLILYLSSFFVKTAKRNAKKGQAYALFNSTMLILPLLIAIFLHYYTADNYKIYYPYSSVIERKVDREREKRININMNRPVPNRNEY